MTPDPVPRKPASRLPHVLAALYALAVVYASLQPFGPWMAPPSGSPFWLWAGQPFHATRFDVLLNVIAYVPLGLFTALQRRGVPSRYVFFPDEGHWILKPANRIVWWHEMLGWLAKYLGPHD